ncbi:MAG: hypothetical protein DRP12_02295 [Candidatus Aenigmatarchaeota archaeon]|nr:MAG: hypothetical protein DRP12_02295 [Candidatus Aenigmarchaeota archaeon]
MALAVEKIPEERPYICQRFDLDLDFYFELYEEGGRLRIRQKDVWEDVISKLEREYGGKTASEVIRDGLKKAGLEYWESNEISNGVPHSILVIGPWDSDIKKEFRQIVEELGLKYRSGPFYVKKD